jgi:lipoprotein-releasing system permease protein
MNLPYFIAKRLTSEKKKQTSISSPILTIAVIAIALGIIMMLVSVATGIGLREKIREKISAFNGHIIISNFDNNQSEVSLTPIDKNQDFYPNFSSVSDINHIQAVITKAGVIRTETTFEGIIFKGVGTDYRFKNLEEYLVQGRIPNVTEERENAEVLISEYLAKRMEFELGDKFTTHFLKDDPNERPNLRQFEIVGIYNSGFQEFDANFIFGDIRHLQRMNRWSPNQIGNFEVFVQDFEKIQQKGKEIHSQTPPTLDTQTIVEKYNHIFEWLKITDSNIYLIIVLMLLVGVINIAVALLVMILERTQMIGILKAMGANNWTLRKIFLHNAFYLITRGLLWGNLIGLGILLIQKYFGVVKLNPESYYVNQAPVYLNWEYILALNIGTILVCLIVLLIPSYIITKISPVKAIRFE